MNILCFIAGHQYRFRINPDPDVLGGAWQECILCHDVKLIHPTRPLSTIPDVRDAYFSQHPEAYPSKLVELLAAVYLADESKRAFDALDDEILYGTRHATLNAGFDESYPTDFFHPYPEQTTKIKGHIPDCPVNNQASMAGSTCYCHGVA